ncbi:DUF2490 domain-containing protein [Candidatus Omnitrophota bacterium]
MIRKIALIFAFALALPMSFSKPGLAYDDGDFQYWNSESASWKIGSDWKVTLEEEFRLGDDATNLYYNHTDLGAAYSGLADWITVGAHYRHILEDKNSDWKEENRPHLNATLKWKAHDVSFGNRARLEYRNREDAENYWRYRNKFSIKPPIKLSRFEIKPYIEDEIFYDFDEETLNRNRLYGGFSLRLIKNLSGQIYYLWESTESSDKWNDTHVLGTKLKLSF